jgi:hypothetical protein
LGGGRQLLAPSPEIVQSKGVSLTTFNITVFIEGGKSKVGVEQGLDSSSPLQNNIFRHNLKNSKKYFNIFSQKRRIFGIYVV